MLQQEGTEAKKGLPLFFYGSTCSWDFELFCVLRFEPSCWVSDHPNGVNFTAFFVASSVAGCSLWFERHGAISQITLDVKRQRLPVCWEARSCIFVRGGLQRKTHTKTSPTPFLGSRCFDISLVGLKDLRHAVQTKPCPTHVSFPHLLSIALCGVC